MKYCSKCGTQLQDDDVFCSKCGSRQPMMEQTKPEPEPQRQVASYPAPSQEEPKPAKRRHADIPPRLRDSVIIMVGMMVAFIIYVILSATVMNENAFIGRLGLLFVYGANVAFMIIRMVKYFNRKLTFLAIVHVCFTAIAAGMLIGNLILLANA